MSSEHIERTVTIEHPVPMPRLTFSSAHTTLTRNSSPVVAAGADDSGAEPAPRYPATSALNRT